MEVRKSFSERLNWLVNEFDKLSVHFNMMLVRIPPLAMDKEYKVAFSELHYLYNAILYLSRLIEVVDSNTSSVNKSAYIQSKVERCSRCTDRIIEQYENLKCRSLDIFYPEQSCSAMDIS